MAIIHLDNFSLDYSEQPLIQNLTLDVHPGEVLVLCGKSGSGKSSLLKFFSGLIPALYPAESKGKAEIFDRSFHEWGEGFPIQKIGMVFQNPKTQFFTQDVYSELAFPMESAGIPQTKMVNTIQTVAEELGLTEFLEKTMFQLSGGEKQLVSFGSVCTLAPQLFLFDEPSSNLDEKTTQKIQTYLHWLKQQGHTIIIAEHRLSYLLELADRFLYLPDGIIWEKEVLAAKSTEELEALGLRQLKSKSLVNQRLFVNSGQKLALKVQDLVYRYPKQNAGVTIPLLELDSHQVIGLVGNNGAGKSTLSKLLTGLFRPKQGQVFLNGKKVKAKELLQESFVVMQDVNLQLFFETVEKEITFKAKNMTDYQEVVEWLELAPLLHRHPQTLSGGEKQRTAIAAALLSGKRILVFDEPTSGQDLTAMKEVSKLIARLQEKSILMIIISHDQEFIQRTCQRVIRLADGRIIADSALEVSV